VERPVIGFLSDFGTDSAAAICRGVILSIARDAQIVDIDHGVRKFAIGDGAFLLWAALPWLPIGTHLAVVDPGVGTARRPIGLRVARGDVLIGPDNGLLMPAASRLGGVEEARLLGNPAFMLPARSATFHGRDLFAPMAAHLAAGRPFDQVGTLVDPATLVGLAFPEATIVEGLLRAEVVYVDSFGNARLAARPADLPGSISGPGSVVRVAVERSASGGRGSEEAELGALPLVRAFGEVAPGRPLLYEDSNGLLAVGVSQGSAAEQLGLATGDRVTIGPAAS
jgi:S-adenosylmethionine hydrolase